MTAPIVISRQGALGDLLLNRPQAMNSLSLDMIRTLTQALVAWQSDPDVHAVVIRSSLPKAFCAGGDIHFFHQVAHGGLRGGSALLEDFFTEEYALNHLIHHYPKPYIALMDGIVMGGGMGITQSSADGCIRIVTERTRMAMPEVNIGLFPDVGAGYFLSRLPGEIGTYLALSGEIISAADALYAGLADVFVPRKELPNLFALLTSVSDHQYRQAIDTFAAPFAAQIDPVNSTLGQHHPLIDQHFSHQDVPTIVAALDDPLSASISASVSASVGTSVGASLSRDDTAFASKTLAAMQARSPLMMCVALEQLRRSATMSVADGLRMERTMVRRCFEHGEVVEGIRALVIDKDLKPQWRPSSLQEVTSEMIAPFFESAWPDDAHPLRELR